MRYSEVVDLAHRVMDEHLKKESPIDLAKRLNTYKQHDRSSQYQDASLRSILRDVNGIAKAHREFKEKVVVTALSGAGALILFLGGELIKCLK